MVGGGVIPEGSRSRLTVKDVGSPFVNIPHHTIHTHTLPIPTLLTLMYTQVPRFLHLYLKEVYDFFDGIDVWKLD